MLSPFSKTNNIRKNKYVTKLPDNSPMSRLYYYLVKYYGEIATKVIKSCLVVQVKITHSLC